MLLLELELLDLRNLQLTDARPFINRRLRETNMVFSDRETPGLGNCFIEALADQTRFDPIHSAMAFTHHDLRYDVVHYVPDMIRLGLLTEDVFTSAYGSVEVWQNRMVQEGTYTDEICIQTSCS